MNNTIFSRRSIREFSARAVSQEDIHTILSAAMAGPSCVNSRDWCFVVVTDKHLLNKMADVNGRSAEPLRGCAFAVLVCGDYSLAYTNAKDYWIIDCAIATQNMHLCATQLGIGSVWLGTYPQTAKVQGQRALFALPDHIIPHSIIAFGYPALVQDDVPRQCYDETKVHFNGF